MRFSIAALRRNGWLKYLPDTSIVLFFLTMAAMLWMLDAREAEQRRVDLARDIQWAEQTIQLRLEDDVASLNGLAFALGHDDIDQADFDTQSTEIISNIPELVSITRVDSDQKPSWSVPPKEGYSRVEAVLTLPDSRLWHDMRKTGQGLFSRAYVTKKGEWFFLLLLPVIKNGQFDGAVVGVFDADSFVRRLPPAWFAEKYQITLLDPDGAEIAKNTQSRLFSSASGKLGLPGTGFSLQARPLRSAFTPVRLLQLGGMGGLMLLTLLSLLSLTRHIRRRILAEEERDRVYRLSQEMLGTVRADTTLLDVNPAFANTLGYDKVNLIGASFIDFIPVHRQRSTRLAFQKFCNGRLGQRYLETEILTQSGDIRWVRWAVSLLQDRNVVYVSGRDITLERQAEEALKRESSFRKTMEDSLSVGMRAVDLQGRITYVNPAFCSITGYTETELLGQVPPYSYWPKDMVEQEKDLLIKTTMLTEQTEEAEFELVLQRKNQAHFYAHMLMSPLIDAHGRHSGWMAALTDVTEREVAKQKLEASHERFVTVVEGLDAAVAVVSPLSHEVFFCNGLYRQWQQMDGIVSESHAYCDVDLSHLLRNESKSDFETAFEFADSTRWLSIRRRPIEWVNGQAAEMILMADITSQHEAEERYERQLEKMQATGRLVTMGEMASTLAHELNQPLSAIANYQAGCMARIKQGKTDAATLIPVMEKVTQQAERAGMIIRRVREFVRQSEPIRQVCSLVSIMDATIAIAEIEARRYGAILKLQAFENLPLLYVDPILIEQVLLNLIKNGIEAMADAPIEQRSLEVRAVVVDERKVLVSILDRGTGVPEALKQRLFDAFFTTKNEGMGMGLNICRTIVEFHQGQLWVEDREGGGSVFKMTLPIAPDQRE